MTHKHAINSVAARERKRIEWATAPIPNEPRRYIPHPRAKAKFRIQLRDLEHGDSLTIRLFKSPWQGRWIVSDKSVNGLPELFSKLKIAINQMA